VGVHRVVRADGRRATYAEVVDRAQPVARITVKGIRNNADTWVG